MVKTKRFLRAASKDSLRYLSTGAISALKLLPNKLLLMQSEDLHERLILWMHVIADEKSNAWSESIHTSTLRSQCKRAQVMAYLCFIISNSMHIDVAVWINF